MARLGVSGLMVAAPMFDDAAAPETAMAVARSSPNGGLAKVDSGFDYAANFSCFWSIA